MNWRSKRVLIPLLTVCSVLVVGIVLVIILTRSNQPSRNINALPIPGLARTTYTNTQFSYTIRYPTQWHITASSDKAQIRMFLINNPAAPEAVAFDIGCFANPNQLSAQSVWQQRQPQDGSETGVGSITLPNGIPAYVAQGEGQTAYRVYTLVKQQKACQIVTYATDLNNSKVVTDAVNSFSWQ